jgi:hypothetical protein
VIFDQGDYIECGAPLTLVGVRTFSCWYHQFSKGFLSFQDSEMGVRLIKSTKHSGLMSVARCLDESRDVLIQTTKIEERTLLLDVIFLGV